MFKKKWLVVVIIIYIILGILYVANKFLVDTKKCLVKAKKNNKKKEQLREKGCIYYLEKAKKYQEIGDLSSVNKYLLELALRIHNMNKKTVKTKTMLAFIYLEIGRNFIKLKKLKLALNNFQKVLLYKQILDKKTILQVLINIQKIYSILGQYDKSFEYYENAFKLFALVYNKKANLYNFYYRNTEAYLRLYRDDISKLRRIVKYFNILLEYEKKCDRPNKMRINYLVFCMAYSYKLLGNENKVFQNCKYLLTNKKYFRFLSNIEKTAYFLMIAGSFEKRCYFHQAIKYYHKLLLIYENNKIGKNKINRIKIYCQLGHLYFELNEFHKAETYLTNALKLIGNNKNWDKNITKCLLGIIEKYIILGKYGCVSQNIKKIFKKESDPILIAVANECMGRLNHKKSQYNKALQYYRKASITYIKYNNIDKERNINILKAKTYQMLENKESQLNCLNKALYLFRGKIRDKFLDYRDKRKLVSLYVEFAEFYISNITKSNEYLLKAKKVATGNYILLSKIILMLTERCLTTGAIDKVKEYIKELKNIHDKIKSKVVLCRYYQIKGILDFYCGNLRKALKDFQKIEEINPDSYLSYFHIGQIYGHWGSNYKAIYYLKIAVKKLKNKKDVLSILNLIDVYDNLATIYLSLNKKAQAYKYLKKIENLLVYCKAFRLRTFMVIFELAYKLLEVKETNCVSMIKRCKRFLNESQKINNISYIIDLNCFIGILYKRENKIYESLKYYNKALEIAKKNGDIIRLISIKIDIGTIFLENKQYEKAIKTFVQLIDYLERRRLTAKGIVRQQYLEQYFYVYCIVATIYVKQNKFEKAYHYLELSKAKTFSENVLNVSQSVSPPSLEKFQKKIQRDKLILMYGAINSYENIKLIIKNNNIFARISKINKQNYFFHKEYITQILKAYKRFYDKRKFNILILSKNINYNICSKKEAFYLSAIVYYYRYILEKAETKYLEDISSELYKYLVSDIKKQIKEKNLVIIPDGALGHLPFETLIRKDNNGRKRYLIEDYKISYIQSAKTYVYLSKPKPKYEKNILAFGGIHYKDEKPANKQSKKEEKEEDEVSGQLGSRKRFKYNRRYLRYISKEIRREGGEIPKSFKEDINGCENLKWTKKTLKEIKKYNGVKTYKGKDVTLKKLEELSKTGELEKYKIIHFGAHGIIFPSVPELSGIVISLNKDDKRPISNYLHVNRILKLKLKADLVVLATCQSGVGEITAEGLNGLTEAFMQAGARNVLVTLWSVYDEYTHIFMKKFYELLHQHPKWSYSKVLREVKLMSIRGELGEGKDREKYKSPCFWGAYVLYGRD